MSSRAALIREWDLLQQWVIPPLLDVRPERTPQVWTLGPAEDAIAVALAYDHAWGEGTTADISVFLSDRAAGPERVHFALADIRCLPQERRRRAFLREDRRFVPNRVLMQRVLLAVPSEPVDLLTVRVEPARGPLGARFDRLRRGGRVLFDRPPPPSLLPDGEFRPIEPSGRLYEKLVECRPFDPSPGQTGPVDTLAARDEQARLVESHYNLARSLARRFAHHGEMSDDLEQVALLALLKASGRYSSDHGSSFATFATASIIGELKRHFRDKTWMLRVPRSLQETYLTVKTAKEELGQTLGCSPTVQQVATHLGISEEAVLAAMEAGDSYWPASLDAPRRGEEDSVTEVPVLDGGFDFSLDRRQLRESLPRLERREQLIVKRLYFDGWTQRRVAEEIGVSQMQVSRLMARTLDKLRDAFVEG